MKKYGIFVITSATAGGIFTGYVQINKIKNQKEQLVIQKKQLVIQKEELNLKAKKFENKILAQRDKLLTNYDEKINVLNKDIHQLQVDMDSRYFWNTINFTNTINEFKEERALLKRRRSLFDLVDLKETEELSVLNKKIKIDNNSLLDDN